MRNSTSLRTLLARLYPTQEDARRVVVDAGLDPAYFQFSDKAVNNWHNILTEAEKRASMTALLQVVLEEYPTNPDVVRVVQAYGVTKAQTTDKVVMEIYTITEIFQKLRDIEGLLTGSSVELPEYPKETKYKAVWNALYNFKTVIRYGRLMLQCKTEEKRTTAYDMAIYSLDEINKEAAKLPDTERLIVLALIELWRKELALWVATMKPENPFTFLEPLRGRKPFVGRDNLLKELKQASTRGTLQPVLLYGLVNSGKSSLIHKAMFDYHEEICFAPFVIPDAMGGVFSLKQILWTMCEALNRRTQHPLPDAQSFQADSKAATEKMIHDICFRFKTTLVLVVGNIDQLYTDTSKPTLQGLSLTSGVVIADSLFAFWWKLAQGIGNLSFVFVSQSADLPANPFTPSLKKLHVGNLEAKEVLSLLNTPTPEFIPLFGPRTVAHIHCLTGGQPFLVQLIAHCIVDRFNRELDTNNKPEPVFLPTDVGEILATEQFRQFGRPYFQQLLGQLEYMQPGSNAFLHTIASHVDGITKAELEQSLSTHFGWARLDNILSWLQTQQIIKLEEEKWRVVSELLRRELE